MVDVTMNDAPGPGRPSLDRLKALDSLASLDEQLKEANKLCNDGHRAQMILRWLSGKLQNDAKCRGATESWKLFEECVRIIAPQTLSVLLSRFDLIGVVKSAVAELDGVNLQPTLSAITLLLNTLTSISQGASGAGVKRLLSTDGVNAATFFQVWIRRVLEIFTESRNVSDLTQNAPAWYAGPAITIWELRRHSASDNASFAEHCLVPCALMLRRIQHNSNLSVSLPRKRAAVSDLPPVSNVNGDLERLLARHVFLPIRAKFNSVQSGGDSATSTSIGTMLKSLKDASDDQGLHREVAPAVLQLLRVALRCVPLQNSQQRARERAWIEAVVLSLLDCLIKDKVMANVHTVAEMLAIIGTKTTLSVQILRNIIRQYCRLGEDDEVFDPDLDLIAAIVKLDANAFVDATLLKQLFQALTRYDSSAWEGDGKPSACATSGLKERIIVPVLTAYAKARRLEEFIAQWYQTLRAGPSIDAPSVFTELGDCLLEILERHLTSEQIASLIEVYRLPSADLQEETPLHDVPELRSNIVILGAILLGVRSDDVIDRLLVPLGLLVDDLLLTSPSKVEVSRGVEAEKIDAVVTGVFWGILKQILQLWLPRWASQQSDEQVVVRRLGVPLENMLEGMADDVGSSQALTGLLDRWRMGRLGADPITEKMESSAVSTLAAVGHPSLLESQTSEGMEEQISRVLKEFKELASTPRARVVLKSTVLMAYNTLLQMSAPVGKGVISQLISELTINDTFDKRHELLVTLLQDVPVASLSYNDRKNIVNGLVGSLAAKSEDDGDSDDEHEADDEVRVGNINPRLSLMTKLLRVPHTDCNLDLDAEGLWQLRAHIDNNADPGAYGTYLNSVDLFDTIARTVLERQLAMYPKSPAFAKQLQRVLRGLDERDVPEFAGEPLCYYVLGNAILRMVDRAAAVPALAKIIDNRRSDFVRDAEGRISALEYHVDPKTVATKGKEEVAAMLGIWCGTLHIFLSSVTLSEIHGLKAISVAATMRNVMAWCKSHSVDPEAELSVICARSALQAYKVAILTVPDDETRAVGLQLLDDRQPPDTRDELVTLLRASATGSLESISDSLGSAQALARPATAEEVNAIQHSISAMSKANLKPEDVSSVRDVYARLLAVLMTSPTYTVHRAVTSCILTALNDKSFLVNQHLAELTLAVLHHLALDRATRAYPLIYLDICTLFSALLKQHRAKLHDRLHLLIPVLQSLLTALFTPIRPSASTFRAHKPLGPKQARSFTRLLTLLCNPPAHHSHKAKSGANNLIDTSRVARRHIGSFVPILLHTYCAQILTGTLGEGVREVLQPALWAMVEAMESRGPEQKDALSAGMNASERAVFTGVYQEWKRVGKWDGA
ncbi:hypothetical protein B0A48_04297 [Cryoendolithus antarcticus]|uniref:Nucleolar 27S pre-rRNA processing Urb2/Npa2 C-terminal domain-containing protein n=1 Tax=Cryoendolithus antarcticus TaxID=1507870 RepID=A0A1V8TFE9_9PEZI|nr:hypothetical protein B0A48_04297 [Cryoendolithus antarcticus]